MHTSRTKLLAVIGDPIEHSMSPLIHGAAIAASGVDYAYVAFRVKDAGAAVAGMRALGLRGFSVTIPHKESVIPFLDELDVSAERTRSVNTIVNTDGRLKGYSTDGAGAVAALRSGGVELAGRKVLVIGTGGAARAIVFALESAGVAAIRFQAVIESQRDTLTRDLEAVRPGIVQGAIEPDLIVNASPIGMHPNVNDLPIGIDRLKPGIDVFDIVYNPLRTRFLESAAAAGCRTVDGVGMFAEQAALQFELFTGEKAPRELMHRTVREALMKAQGR